MFSKKILSIVGLLFIGSQITSVSADCSITLTNGDGADSVECTCDVKGYYVVQGTSTEQGAELTLNAGSGTVYKYVMVTGDDECLAIDANSGSDSRRFRSSTTFSLDGSKDITLGDSKSYILTDGDTIFTGTGTKKVIVKSTSNSVVLDRELMGKTYNYCVDSNLRVLNRKEDLCTNSSGECEYYQCANGECKKEAENLPPLIERANPDCNLNSPDDETCQNGGYYLYGSNDRTNVLNTEEAGTVEGSLKLAHCTKNAQSGKWLCIDVNNAEIPIGYVPNAGAGGEYIECTNDGCTAVKEIESRLKELIPGTYMIDIGSTSLLGITQPEKFVNVIRTGNSVYVDRVSGGYYTVSKTAQQTGAYPVDNNAASADLYLCDAISNISKCEKVDDSNKPIGYLINKGVGSSGKPFIKCDVKKSCVALTPGGQTSCGDNHGDLYVDGESTKICGVTDGSNELILAGTNAINDVKYYIASVSTANDKLFGIENKTDYFIVLKFEGGNVTVENDPNARYRYTKKNSNLIVSRSAASTDNGTGGICEGTGDARPNAFEYILANWEGAKADLDDISYYVSEDYTE